ncbi:MAG: hypothetical protein AAF333_07900 [Planctomycetota bacterium]
MPDPEPPTHDQTPTPGRPGAMSHKTVVDHYFLEHRAKLLDLAAFLDRCERAEGGNTGDDDFRLQAMRSAVELLVDGQPDRTRRILERLSDLSTDLLDHAPGKSAAGAPPPPNP